MAIIYIIRLREIEMEMNTILNIIKELRANPSSKAKEAILKANSNNELLKKVLKYAYDKVHFTYGVTVANIEKHPLHESTNMDMFEFLDKLANREITGHEALRLAKSFLNKGNAEIFKGIIDHDFKAGINDKTLNKIWKGLVPQPQYCRCDVFNKKNASKIQFPAYIQLKCDGTYREAFVNNGVVTFKTRSGESYLNPVLAKEMENLPNGYYTGEFTIGQADGASIRAVGNGLINSDNPPYDEIIFTVWDYLTEEEYALKESTPYKDRFEKLKDLIKGYEHISLVPSTIVNNVDEALKVVSDYMNKGLEGGVLKSFGMKFKNGTSKEQLKIKLKVDVEVRCVGFQLGTKGTKYESKNKVILFENDEHTIKGQCSGMTDAMVDEVTKNPDKYVGKVLSVEFNDLVKAEGHDFYALSHPRFAEWRDDKNETDNLEKAFKLRDMAKSL